MKTHPALLLSGCLLYDLCAGVPVQAPSTQRLLDVLRLPAVNQEAASSGADPYTPDHKDPYDRAVDSVGDDLDPLPWRNGLGASVLGPWNRERSRQSPDLVRPPSTDHGNLANMRWSFADSHIRIEVSFDLCYIHGGMYLAMIFRLTPVNCRRAAGPARQRCESSLLVLSWLP